MTERCAYCQASPQTTNVNIYRPCGHRVQRCCVHALLRAGYLDCPACHDPDSVTHPLILPPAFASFFVRRNR